MSTFSDLQAAIATLVADHAAKNAKIAELNAEIQRLSSDLVDAKNLVAVNEASIAPLLDIINAELTPLV